MPAKAGTHFGNGRRQYALACLWHCGGFVRDILGRLAARQWVPAFAGMTIPSQTPKSLAFPRVIP